MIYVLDKKKKKHLHNFQKNKLPKKSPIKVIKIWLTNPETNTFSIDIFGKLHNGSYDLIYQCKHVNYVYGLHVTLIQ